MKTSSSGGIQVTSLEPLGYQRIPTSGTGVAVATALTPPLGAVVAMIQSETVSLRWRDDTHLASGANPTATTGNLIPANETFVADTHDELYRIKVIEVSAGAVVNVNYYG